MGIEHPHPDAARPQDHPDDIARLRREVAALQREFARIRTSGRSRPGRARLVAALGLALFIALVPLSLLAANPFTDLNPGSVHNDNIDAIYNAGVTTGCVPNLEYCPNANVTREEMASFLARLGGLGANPPVANAAQLNGLPASAYAQKSQFKGTEVLDASGPLPLSRSYTSNGGILVVFVSGSAFFTASGMLGIELDITGPESINNATILQVFTNEANSHKAFPSEVEVISSLSAGNYTFTLRERANTNTNGNDRFTISVIEIPRP